MGRVDYYPAKLWVWVLGVDCLAFLYILTLIQGFVKLFHACVLSVSVRLYFPDF
jgi:hypothetical protein